MQKINDSHGSTAGKEMKLQLNELLRLAGIDLDKRLDEQVHQSPLGFTVVKLSLV